MPSIRPSLFPYFLPSLLPALSYWFSKRSTQFIAMTSTSLSPSRVRRASYTAASSRVNSK